MQLAGAGVHRVDDAHLAGADDRGRAVDGRRDRRGLHVVVHEVVRPRPGSTSAASRSRRPGSRRCRCTAARTGGRSPTRPTGTGCRCRRSPIRRCRPAASPRPRRSRPRARARLARRSVSVLNLHSSRPVAASEREQHPAARPEPVGAGQVHPPAGHLRLDLERPLAAAQQVACRSRRPCRWRR